MVVVVGGGGGGGGGGGSGGGGAISIALKPSEYGPPLRRSTKQYTQSVPNILHISNPVLEGLTCVMDVPMAMCVGGRLVHCATQGAMMINQNRDKTGIVRGNVDETFVSSFGRSRRWG